MATASSPEADPYGTGTVPVPEGVIFVEGLDPGEVTFCRRAADGDGFECESFLVNVAGAVGTDMSRLRTKKFHAAEIVMENPGRVAVDPARKSFWIMPPKETPS